MAAMTSCENALYYNCFQNDTSRKLSKNFKRLMYLLWYANAIKILDFRSKSFKGLNYCPKKSKNGNMHKLEV